MSLVNGGVGNLIGYLGTGFWFQASAQDGGSRWPVFWSGLAASVVLVLIFFLIAYHGQGAGFRRESTGGEAS